MSQNDITDRPAISLVIPVYNVAAHLPQCLDSVAGQTGCIFEAICVDDGSTDGSGAILDEYAARDTRFRVVRQENRGTHAARRRAVMESHGEWCLFLDPDDWLESGALSRLAPMLAATSADIVGFGFQIHADDALRTIEQALSARFNPDPGSYDRDRLFEAAFVSQKVPAHLIGKAVRAEVCRKAFSAMSERRLVFQEDICAFFRIAAESTAAITVADRFYNYRIGPGISYRRYMTRSEFFGSLAKFDELNDLKAMCAERFREGSAAANALEKLEMRLVVASVSEAIERMERQEDGREGVRRLRELCGDAVVSAACAEWYRLKGVALADAARAYGVADLLGDVALRQLDYVWRGHNSRLRALGDELASVRRELGDVRCQLADERVARERLEAKVRHPVRALLRKLWKPGTRK